MKLEQGVMPEVFQQYQKNLAALVGDELSIKAVDTPFTVAQSDLLLAIVPVLFTQVEMDGLGQKKPSIAVLVVFDVARILALAKVILGDESAYQWIRANKDRYEGLSPIASLINGNKSCDDLLSDLVRLAEGYVF